MDQAVADAYPGHYPTVLMRENRGRFMLLSYLTDLQDIHLSLMRAKQWQPAEA